MFNKINITDAGTTIDLCYQVQSANTTNYAVPKNRAFSVANPLSATLIDCLRMTGSMETFKRCLKYHFSASI